MPGTRTPADTLAQQPVGPPQGQWTYADYARLPNDGWRYEVYMLRDGAYVLLGKFGPGDTIRSQVLAGFDVAVDQVLPFTHHAV